MSLVLSLWPAFLAGGTALYFFLDYQQGGRALRELVRFAEGKSRRIQRQQRGGEIKMPIKGIIGLVAAVFILIVGINAIAIVPAGYNGAVFNLWIGVKEQPLPSGIHLILPFFENVTMIETRTQLTEQEASAVSKDLQIVTTSVALNYRPIESATAKIFKEIGTSYAERIIVPTIQESVKAVTANYTAEELITQRPRVKSDIKEILVLRLTERDILVDDISITNFKFSDQFDAAIEAKVTAEQEALQAEREWERIKIEKQQAITQAEGRADSMEKEADAIAYKRTVEADAEAYALEVIRQQLEKSNQLIEYKMIEAWDGILPQFTSGAVPFIDVGKYTN